MSSEPGGASGGFRRRSQDGHDTDGTFSLREPRDCYVIPFAEGSRDDVEHLGGKGASLAEMTRLDLPVPPGFVIPTRACLEYLDSGELAPELMQRVAGGLRSVERQLGRRFGDPRRPLLLSVRSGAPVSMPGMMDTLLNVGLSRQAVDGLADLVGPRSFAFDCLGRLIRSFATVVSGLRPEALELGDSTPPASEEEVEALLDLYRRGAGEAFPEDAREQLRRAIVAVFDSWNSRRARRYRRFRSLPETGTAVVVQAMVFGNAGPQSGTGVMFTRNPSTGEKRLFGDYLPHAQGEDIVGGGQNAGDLEDMVRLVPEAYEGLREAAQLLERHYQDMCDIEFTVERGKLWLLQTRVGQRSTRAALRIAAEMAAEGLITPEEALSRIEAPDLEGELLPRLDEEALGGHSILATGVAASPGIARGVATFEPEHAVSRHEAGKEVVLIRPETTPKDLDGIIAAAGLLTTRGGKTSHAAVVARGLGRACVCGLEEGEFDPSGPALVVGGCRIADGEEISIDGEGGRLIAGLAPVREASPPAELGIVLGWADRRRGLSIDALVASASDVRRALEHGADGLVVNLTPDDEAPALLIERYLLASGGASVSFRVDMLEAGRPAHLRWFAAVRALLGRHGGSSCLVVAAATVEELRAGGAIQPDDPQICAELHLDGGASGRPARDGEVGLMSWDTDRTLAELVGGGGPVPWSGAPIWVLPPDVTQESVRLAKAVGAQRIVVAAAPKVVVARVLAGQLALMDAQETHRPEPAQAESHGRPLSDPPGEGRRPAVPRPEHR